MSQSADPCVYVVTDIETDGPWPDPNSMRSFGSVAVTMDGRRLGEFEAVLEPLPGAAPNPDTRAWFDTVPGAWDAATAGARPIADVLAEFAAWVRGLPSPRAFAASPLVFDGTWFDHYLRRFTPYGLAQGPYETDPLFTAPALCLRSYAAGVTGRPMSTLSPTALPAHWLGDVEHTHRAIDDARGYANLLVHLATHAGPPRLTP